MGTQTVSTDRRVSERLMSMSVDNDKYREQTAQSPFPQVAE